LSRYARATVGVVGLGPTGASFTWHLLRALAVRPCGGPLRITMIDPSAELGAGYAFRSKHRLNMRADTLSIDPGRPGHFASWLKGSGQSDCPESSYPPRAQFGRYIVQMLDHAITAASAPDLEIEHWQAHAVDIEDSGDSLLVTGSDGRQRAFGILVLTLGESRYNALSHYSGERNFIDSSWATSQLEDIPEDAAVAVAGTSLSAVDACIQLLDQGHQGNIACLSRTRGFPKVQGPCEDYEPQILTDSWLKQAAVPGGAPVRLRQVISALKEELEYCMGAPYDPGAIDPREWFSADGVELRGKRTENEVFRDSVVQAGKSHTRWYYALDSLSPITPRVWNVLAKRDQTRFLRHYRAAWNEYRHSMPMVNASRLLPSADAGQLIIRSGLRSLGPASRRAARWIAVTGPAGHEEAYDFLIDATGGQNDIACQREPLLQACVRRGLAKLDPRGGLQVTFDSCRLVDASGQARNNLYFVGPLTFGTHFYTNSFETNRDNAYRVAAEIEQVLRSNRPGPYSVQEAHSRAAEGEGDG